jgi:hypothetical protein
MVLSKRDKKYIKTRLIRITDAKNEICAKMQYNCKDCPLNEDDKCNDLDLPPIDLETMRLDTIE